MSNVKSIEIGGNEIIIDGGRLNIFNAHDSYDHPEWMNREQWQEMKAFVDKSFAELDSEGVSDE